MASLQKGKNLTKSTHWHPMVDLFMDLYPPPPALGAGRVKLMLKSWPGLSSPPPSPGTSKNETPATDGSVRVVFLFINLSPQLLHAFFKSVFPFFFYFGSHFRYHLGSILVPFSLKSAYLYRTQFSHAFFIELH